MKKKILFYAIAVMLAISFGLYVMYDSEKAKRKSAEKRMTIKIAKELALKNVKEKHNEAKKNPISLAADTIDLLERLDN